MGAVVAEYLGSSAGLGHLIAQAEGVLDATGVFSGIIVPSIPPSWIALDALVDRAEKRLLVCAPCSGTRNLIQTRSLKPTESDVRILTNLLLRHRDGQVSLASAHAAEPEKPKLKIAVRLPDPQLYAARARREAR